MSNVFNVTSELTTNLEPIQFHSTTGKNIVLSDDKFEAVKNEEYFLGYVFTAMSIEINQHYLMRIRNNNPTNKKSRLKHVNALNFGLTACNPSTLQHTSLPSDPKQLIRRYEYWDFANLYKFFSPSFTDFNEYYFVLLSNGDLKCYQNTNRPEEYILFKYAKVRTEPNIRLWAFLEIIDSTQILRLFKVLRNNNNNYSVNISRSREIGFLDMPLLSRPYPSVRTPKTCQLCNTKKVNTVECANFSSICDECYNEQKTALEKTKTIAKELQLPSAPSLNELGMFASTSKTLQRSESSDKLCIICLDAAKTHVIVPCGHYCLCAACSKKITKDKCPICKGLITDIIRIY